MAVQIKFKGLTNIEKKGKMFQAEKGTSSGIFLAKRAVGWCEAVKEMLMNTSRSICAEGRVGGSGGLPLSRRR